ncbi:hypothetical protein RFI_25472 [Reticulomyxa filosa]|uniref:Molybdate-anion transporter n=1 Tax=Reticulomyxa filosa TaxID=46433 RepID=X6MET3_RETFI|nr:hypothetical protein RFI_25472 [Reticulomyxa filosa]|eukprot:ETO11902.1 hypothetical protein RFI_25472 [Reticulomyxa filosa]
MNFDLLREHHIHFLVLFLVVLYLKSRLGWNLFLEKKTVNNNAETTKKFYQFQGSYVVIFLMVMLADWMQQKQKLKQIKGPYVYQLYHSYGYPQEAIALLFVVGFGTAGVFGIIVGGLTDRFGRRLTCISFCIFYMIACITKHYSDFRVLMLGRSCYTYCCTFLSQKKKKKKKKRFLGGVSTAILFSGFESYMVTHHHLCHFPSGLLSDTFQLAWGWNSIVAVLAGVITSTAVHIYSQYNIFGGTPPEVAAFDCSSLALIVAMVLIWNQWEENYGDVTSNVSDTIAKSIKAFRTDKKIFLLGVIQSGFESSMYLCNKFIYLFIHFFFFIMLGNNERPSKLNKNTVVFMWSPSLEKVSGDRSRVDHGWIFANFMLCCLIGNDVYGGLTKRLNWSAEYICLILCVGSGHFPHTLFFFFFFKKKKIRAYYIYIYVYLVLLLVLFVCTAVCMFIVMANSYEIRLLSFFIFEFFVGLWFPTVGVLRGRYVQDEIRATVMNIFRIPLNLIVVFVLWNIESWGPYVWYLNALLLSLSAATVYHLGQMGNLTSAISHVTGDHFVDKKIDIERDYDEETLPDDDMELLNEHSGH